MEIAMLILLYALLIIGVVIAILLRIGYPNWKQKSSDTTAIVNAAIALYNHRNPKKRRIEDEMHLESALDEAVQNYLNNQKGEIHVN